MVAETCFTKCKTLRLFLQWRAPSAKWKGLSLLQSLGSRELSPARWVSGRFTVLQLQDLGSSAYQHVLSCYLAVTKSAVLFLARSCFRGFSTQGPPILLKCNQLESKRNSPDLWPQYAANGILMASYHLIFHRHLYITHSRRAIVTTKLCTVDSFTKCGTRYYRVSRRSAAERGRKLTKFQVFSSALSCCSLQVVQDFVMTQITCKLEAIAVWSQLSMLVIIGCWSRPHTSTHFDCLVLCHTNGIGLRSESRFCRDQKLSRY